MDLATIHPALQDLEKVQEYDFIGCWTRQNPDGPYEPLDVAMALSYTRGNISAAARILGRSRRSLHGFIVRDQLLSDFLEDLEACFLDELEERHRETALIDKDARQFFLRTKGRNRGYVTRNEATGANGTPIELVTLDAAAMSTESLRELREALNAPSE